MSDAIRVMVVDDQGLVREGLMTLLGTAPGITAVVAAADGAQAVALAARHRPDVVLMDLRMPVMDGITAIRHIRRRTDGKAGLPVIVVTADDGPSIDSDCLAAGADDVLHKPISMGALFGAIGTVLAGRGDESAVMIA